MKIFKIILDMLAIIGSLEIARHAWINMHDDLSWRILVVGALLIYSTGYSVEALIKDLKK